MNKEQGTRNKEYERRVFGFGFWILCVGDWILNVGYLGKSSWCFNESPLGKQQGIIMESFSSLRRRAAGNMTHEIPRISLDQFG